MIHGDRLFFIRDAALVWVPFDAEAGEVTGEPVIAVRDIATESIFGQAQFALSESGALAYLPGSDRAVGKIAWVDRDGTRGTLPVEPRIYGTLDLAPDDRRIAVHVGDVRDYIWIYDLESGSGRKLPSGVASGWPNWKNTENAVSYTEMGDVTRIVEQRVDTRSEPRAIAEAPVSGARCTTIGDTFTASEPELAFEIPFLDTPGTSYDVTSDGKRLYTIVQAEEDIVDRIHVLTTVD